uniref:Uncharacterized protein n=1 Tax=Anguilla anguilla TaxID=7936 RepID=A0A0E9TAM4_ANGAN
MATCLLPVALFSSCFVAGFRIMSV